MSVFHTNALAGASGRQGAGGGAAQYQISRSLRFNSADSAYLSRTPASAGNRKTWTWSGWVKRSALSTTQVLMGVRVDASTYTLISFIGDNFYFYNYGTGSGNAYLYTTALYRDPSAWYHIVVVYDADNAIQADRMRLYFNGGRETNVTAGYPTGTGWNSLFNTTGAHEIGRDPSAVNYLSGYLADIHFIDGQALTPSSFGETDATTGEWIPKAYTGGYGLVSVAAATGGLPIYNTTDTYGTVKGTGTRTDSNSSAIVLAVPMNGTNGGTTFTDESATIKGSGVAVTLTPTSATTSTSESKYYGSSGNFTGVAARLVFDKNVFLGLNGFDFTIEMWVKITGTVSTFHDLTGLNGSGYTNAVTLKLDSGRLSLGDWGAGNFTSVTDPDTLPTGKWVHVAYTKSGTTGRVFVNGIQKASGTLSASSFADIGVNATIGARNDGSYAFPGYIQDVRVYKGVAKYTANFTPVVSSNNSFRLDFADNSAATAAAIGKDTSGNNNNWSPLNLQVITGGPTSVAAATGALPIHNTSGTYGTTIETGLRADSVAASLVLAAPLTTAGSNALSDDEVPSGRVSSVKTLTATGTITSDTSIYKYYGGSASFAANSYYSLNSSDFTFGTGDFTIEAWVYNPTGTSGSLFSTNTNALSGTTFNSRFYNTGVVDVYTGGGSDFMSISGVPLNAWVHIAMVRSGGDSMRVFINGEQKGGVGVWTANMQDSGNFYINNGRDGSGARRYQDVRVYKGLAKYSSNFDPPTATFNTTIGTQCDSLVDTPTSYGTDTGVGGEVRGNYCTLNPLDAPDIAASNGNLDLANATASNSGARGTFTFPSAGKWYYEGSAVVLGSNLCLGFARGGPASANATASNTYYLLTNSSGVAQLWVNGSGSTNYSGVSVSAGSVIKVAYDSDNSRMWFGVNNVWLDSSGGTTGNPATGANPTVSSLTGSWIPSVSVNTSTISLNFGQRPFAYTAPSGFKALCDTNLPAPTIVKPSTVMDVILRNGFGASGGTVTGLNFSPDLIWEKPRSIVGNHYLTDSVRGTASQLYSNLTNAEGTLSTYVTAFNSNGYSMGSSDWATNNTVAAWCWDAGSSTVTNTAGTITSQVRANASAGFSIVTYTGTGANATVGHGLGVAPQFYVVKNRSVSGEWYGYHVSSGAGNYLLLNTTAAATASTTVWNNTAPGSTVFSLGASSSNTASSNFVAYCFAPVAGYSAFGSYTGNGSADGPFVYTGFRPRWVMVKPTSGASSWFIYDAARSPRNISDLTLLANSSAGGNAYEGMSISLPIDILSNGFKLRYADAGGYTNYSTWNYIWAAFAEFPFQYARAR